MTSLARHPLAVIAAASAWMATVGNLPLWEGLRRFGLLDSASGWALAAALAVVLAGCTAALLSLLAWRWTLKAAITLLLLVTAAAAYFMLAYHVVVDPGMLVNVVETDWHEAADLWSLRLPLCLALLAGLPAWGLARVAVRWRPPARQLLHNLGAAAAGLALAAVAILVAFQPLASAMRNHKELRYMMSPLNSVYAAGVLAARPFAREAGPVAPVGRDAVLGGVAGGKPPLLVLVVGETGRSGNFGLNGYARDTAPELAAQGVASFTNAWACGTSTATALPCMFSALGREGFSALRQPQENLLDVLQHAGLAVLWLDNQAGCKGVCDRVPHASVASSNDPRLCRDGECLDGILLEGLDARIDALPAERRARGVVLVLHQMGSHGPAYWRRSPPESKRFGPECRSANLQDCSREQLVDAYDNSIAYTDHVLSSTIGWLREREDRWDAAMVYVADHGESLGENNLYLHGLPYAIAPDVQKHVPWITWLSPGFERRSGVELACLRGRRDTRVSHDHLFHSVLALLDVRTAAFAPGLDAYADCTRPAADGVASGGTGAPVAQLLTRR